MTTPEFTIRIDARQIAAEYGLPGEQPTWNHEEGLKLDPLTLDTAALLNRWLCFWDRILDSNLRTKEFILDSNTLRILGTHLWQLIFGGSIGQELRARIPSAGGMPLRLSIGFTDEANAILRGLPWEFLYEPTDESFLSTRTELLLTRYVKTKARSRIQEVGEVRALLIAALPGNGKFDRHRDALNNLGSALNDIDHLTVVPIDTWDHETVKTHLTHNHYDIIHVMGRCKGEPGSPKIYLGSHNGDGFEDPDIFVETLTIHRDRPGLVILQLCDFEDGDATENFERLAPKLIKRRVPAVLALQYAAKADQADHVGVGKSFYERIVTGKSIGRAVQESRDQLRSPAQAAHRFGTPVLYLDEDGVLFRPRSGGPSPKSAGNQPSPVQAALLTVVLSAELPDVEFHRLVAWIMNLDSKLDVIKVAELLRAERLRTPQPAVYQKMVEALVPLFSRGGHD